MPHGSPEAVEIRHNLLPLSVVDHHALRHEANVVKQLVRLVNVWTGRDLEARGEGVGERKKISTYTKSKLLYVAILAR